MKEDSKILTAVTKAWFKMSHAHIMQEMKAAQHPPPVAEKPPMAPQQPPPAMTDDPLPFSIRVLYPIPCL
jgi:hypothetical protein